MGTLEFDSKQVVRKFSPRKYLFKDLESARESAMEISGGKSMKSRENSKCKACEGQPAQGV